MKCVMWTLSLLAAVLLLCGCKTKSVPQMEYMPDMYRQVSVRAQEADPNAPGGVGMRQPVAGTVPREHAPYPYALEDSLLADKMVNPLEPTPEVLKTGKKHYDTYCIVCHGPKADGNGFIVPKFPKPPTLFSDKVVKWPDGRIFHTMTRGQALMSSYASQILTEDRWAIIHYVRQLQREARPELAKK